MKPLFKEYQKFNQWWLWVILLAILAFSIFTGVSDYLSGGSWLDTVVLIAVGALGAILMAVMSLKTVVTKDGIETGFGPLGTKRIFRSEIDRAYVRKYDAIKEYGGWGIRFGKNGRAYNVSGDYGLQLELKDGKSIMIGTQRPEEMEAVMNNYLAKGEVLDTLDLEEIKIAEKMRRGR